MADKSVRDAAERYWSGMADTVREDHPVRALIADGRSEVLAPGLLTFQRLAAVAVVDTGDSLVLLDSGGPSETDYVHESVRKWCADKPVEMVIHSHHHIDHIFGVGPFDAEAERRQERAPVVVAHCRMAGHLDRYRSMRGWNTAINSRQRPRPEGFEWPVEYRYPDIQIDAQLTQRVGSVQIEVHTAVGETDDALWTWLPDQGAIFAGDLFIWALPNAGNPQKVQRHSGGWAAALRAMMRKDADTLIAGHGPPIFGESRVRRALSETAEVLEVLEERTIDLMNRGLPVDEIVEQVELPGTIANRPYLQPVYDDPSFIVRNVYRLYGGWYTGRPDELLPASALRLDQEIVRLAGGLQSLLARARELRDCGELELATHLVEHATRAHVDSEDSHRLRSDIYRRRADRESSFMARGIFQHAAASSDAGVLDAALTRDP